MLVLVYILFGLPFFLSKMYFFLLILVFCIFFITFLPIYILYNPFYPNFIFCKPFFCFKLLIKIPHTFSDMFSCICNLKRVKKSEIPQLKCYTRDFICNLRCGSCSSYMTLNSLVNIAEMEVGKKTGNIEAPFLSKASFYSFYELWKIIT